MNENETGAQFAARQHLQTVQSQEVIIAGQQQEIDRLSKQTIEQAAEIVRLGQVLRAEQAEIGRLYGERAAGVVAGSVVDEGLIELMYSLRQNYGDVGTRDVDVAAQQRRIDRAIIQLGLIVAHDGRERPTPRPTAKVEPVSDDKRDAARFAALAKDVALTDSGDLLIVPKCYYIGKNASEVLAEVADDLLATTPPQHQPETKK